MDICALGLGGVRIKSRNLQIEEGSHARTVMVWVGGQKGIDVFLEASLPKDMLSHNR